MVFVLDIGNTNVKCGLFHGDKLMHSWRMSSDTLKTSDEYGIEIMSFFEYLKVRPDSVKGIIIASVIPSVNYTFGRMAETYFNMQPLFVGPGIKTGLNIKYQNPKELGADRIVNAVAARALYGGDVITVDLGTATSFGAINADGDFLGGAICPGIKISADALITHTAKLPHIELTMPDDIIGTNTVAGMQAGILYGYIGQVEYIIKKMKERLPAARVIATGGMIHIITSQTSVIDEINPRLTLIGLNILFNKNR